jgi:hypothetical protein
MIEESITIDRISSDYLHPAEKVKCVPTQEENVMDNNEDKSIYGVEATRSPDIDVDEYGNIIEKEHISMDVVENVIEPIGEVTADVIDMNEDNHNESVIDEPVQELNEQKETVSDIDYSIEDVVDNISPIEDSNNNGDGDLSYDIVNESIENKSVSDKVDFEIPKHNFNVKWEPKFAAKDNKEERNLINELSILGGNADEFNFEADKVNDSEKFTTDNERMFLAYLKSAAELYHGMRSFDKTLLRENSQWEQAIMSDIGPLALSKPNFGKSNNKNISGEKAILKMSSIMNLGQLMSVPLWHSGLWIKLKAPSDAALLALENRIAEEKVMLGRQTNGFVFSNSSAYIYDYLINLILSCVYDVSYVKQSVDDLKQIIKITDIPTLVWGFLCTIYPNGYPIAQPCINNIGKCNHIEHEMVSISKLMWLDKSSLTPAQIKHMTKRDVKMTEEEIKKYQDELQVGGDKLVSVNDNLSVKLSVPSIQDYISSGYNWVEGIERMVTQSFAVTKQGDERNEYIVAMSKTMALRQYAHWIKEINIYDDPSDPESVMYITDRDTLEESMDTLSKDIELGEVVMKKITEYIDGATMAVVGIPRYLCPVCNEDQGKFLPENRYIIPLDVVKVFFTLQNQRLLKVSLAMSE